MLCRYIVTCFLCVSVCLSGLSGCTLITRHYGATSDGAPNFNLDASGVPDAVLREEYKPHFCNPSSYVVRGKRYHVLKSGRNYRERGVASWYGTRFHRGKTSTGECYNMLAMTAAHRTLPIPSYVRVTNLRNARQVIVKLNDRGPFKEGRIIDLSYAAAKKLGVAESGTAPVEVSVVEPGQMSSYANKAPIVPVKKSKKSQKKSHKPKSNHKRKRVLKGHRR